MAIVKKKDKFDTTKHDRRDQTEKNIGVEKLELGKRYQEVIEKIKKKPPAKKKQQRKQKVKMLKHKQKMRVQKRKQKMRMQKRKQKKSKERSQKSW